MRIINGTLKGRRFTLPGHIPTRPTTDFAKTGLFNILDNRIDYEETIALDLFHGTGSISIELVSRGCKQVTSVDIHTGCNQFLRQVAVDFKLPITVIKADALPFVESLKQGYDLIFADPPYDWPSYMPLVEMILNGSKLNTEGWLIIEHDTRHDFSLMPRFVEERKYGNVHFSFFK